MVVRKRRNDISDHPVSMTRFDLDEWPGEPAEALQEWRAAFFAYWHGRRSPGGLFWLLATTQAAKRLALHGEIVSVDDLIAEKIERGRWA